MTRLSGDVAIVTVAAQGIGAAYARGMAEEGARMVVTDMLDPKPVVPEMRRKQYGKIINIASTIALKGSPMLLHYKTSKGAVIAMSRAMAREVGDDNICVNTIAPGLTMSQNVLEQGLWADEWIANNKAGRSLKRLETSDDLVGAVIFLSLREADFITGQVLVIDGGAVAH
jgi:NAD(P)-dependent dehydrogenase (short-subunit alcohol dehydrogenase family)